MLQIFLLWIFRMPSNTFLKDHTGAIVGELLSLLQLKGLFLISNWPYFKMSSSIGLSWSSFWMNLGIWPSRNAHQNDCWKLTNFSVQQKSGTKHLMNPPGKYMQKSSDLKIISVDFHGFMIWFSNDNLSFYYKSNACSLF